MREHPKVALNHFYFVVTETTYEALKEELFSKSFSHCLEKTTNTSDGRTWTGLYFYGKETYFEIFKAGENWEIGETGIGLSVETIGGNQLLKELGQWDNLIDITSMYQETKDGQIPWFSSLYLDHDDVDGKLAMWVMEYEKSFFKAKQYKTKDENDISRVTNLRGSYDPNKSFKNIKSIELSLSSGDYNRFKDFAQGLKIDIETYDHGMIIRLESVDIQVTKAPNPIGVVAFTVSGNFHDEKMTIGDMKVEAINNVLTFILN